MCIATTWTIPQKKFKKNAARISCDRILQKVQSINPKEEDSQKSSKVERFLFAIPVTGELGLIQERLMMIICTLIRSMTFSQEALHWKQKRKKLVISTLDSQCLCANVLV